MAFVYHKPLVFCYQTFDRQSLQLTSHPVFPIFNPPPPDESSPPDEQACGEAEQPNDPPNDEHADAGDVGDSTEGKS